MHIANYLNAAPTMKKKHTEMKRVEKLIRNKGAVAATFSVFVFLFSIQVFAQETENNFHGTVYAASDSSGLPGVHVMLFPSMRSVQTDVNGHFIIPKPALSGTEKMVFMFTGMQNDTVQISAAKNNTLTVYLKINKNELKSVNIKGRKDATHMDLMSTGNMQTMGQGELLKAACCNLSESFETTPSVDVGFTDAVTGYRQIQLLGLAGANTSFTRENIPDARGLASITGLTFTPGTWVESMQLSKGIGSVVNGYEGIAGQINVEWWKSFMKSTPTWYLNAYQSTQGRSEANAIYNHRFNGGLSTGLFLHASTNWLKVDQNKDGFLDNPLGPTLVGSNRWFWFTKSNWEYQLGVKGVYVDHTGGQTNYSRDEIADTAMPWGYHQILKRIEGWAKIGKVYQSQPWKSMGLQLSTVYHDQNSLYGLREYDGKEKSFYANYIYQSIIGNTNNVIKAGASYLLDNFNENFIGQPYTFTESVPGIFSEYSFKYLNKFGLVAGLRADYHNLYGLFVTPRLHIRYAPVENSVFRISAGRAQRTANIFAENAGYLVSNRSFIIDQDNPKGAYGLNPEIAWNMGLSFLQKFRLNYRDGTFQVDYFYTDFQNQVVVDIENPHEVRFYNLNGRSFAHSFQAQLDYEPIRFWDVRLAYRYYLIETDYDGVLKEKPLVAANRAFLNTGYQTDNNWKLDYTLTWTGKKRIPAYFLNQQEVAAHFSPSFVQMNLQLSKSWNKGNFDWYIGVENLTNYMQPDIILDAEHPFSSGFDGSLVWGPGVGRNIYTGIRWKIK